MVYRGLGYAARRAIALAVVALVSALPVTTVVSSASPVAHAAGTALPSPALGHANEYSTVPSVAGKSVAAAIAVLKKARLGALVHAPSMTALVYNQSPIAGIRVLQGAVVSIWAGVATRP